VKCKVLKTIHTVLYKNVLLVICRPAYMDEYEALEESLQKLYDDFMMKFRNQAYLEQLLEEHDRVEQDKTEVGGPLWEQPFFHTLEMVIPAIPK